eukprot:CAMPEP_0204123558 /NCGR_PEP_ID=MMETSP0361-20130328/9364_1 /ASSEMBLY_ACC=CAM_ASM_000343 /TAXON_ID=268821 /ORGANISM="Scrippsiella Hangoei, Strain SHTV-5" /LENGTH=50 /DNA_ID=CAMNT_0051075037 /DNA_START=107 /DNA_END=256 /DNA_ORIENTATION=-
MTTCTDDIDTACMLSEKPTIRREPVVAARMETQALRWAAASWRMLLAHEP